MHGWATIGSRRLLSSCRGYALGLTTVAGAATTLVLSCSPWSVDTPVLAEPSQLASEGDAEPDGVASADTAADASSPASDEAAVSRMQRVEDMSPYERYKTRLYGNYENRLRLHSDPEKVFEYFATVEDEDGDWLMTPDDFLRAITPYNPATHTLADDDKRRFVNDLELAKQGNAAAAKRLYSTHGSPEAAYFIDPPARIESIHAAGMTTQQYTELLAEHGFTVSCDGATEFTSLVDQDGDGLLSYGEYIFFLTLLAIPSAQFVLAFRMFDRNDDGGIDQDEFQRIMAIMRHRHPQGRAVRDKNLLGENLHRVDSGGMLRQFFGVDGSKKLSAQEFGTYVRHVQRAIREREFALADVGNTGYLSPLEFALYLVSHAPPDDQEKLIERARGIEASAEDRVSKVDFLAFCELLSHLPLLRAALDVVSGADDGVSQEEFRHATRAVLKSSDVSGVDVCEQPTGFSSFFSRTPEVLPTAGLTPLQVSIIFALFDDNGDNELDRSEFLDIMEARASRGLDKERGFDISWYLKRMIACARQAT